jgi:hypothetical protein
MKRIVRLTESDLARIVKRVIREQEETNEVLNDLKADIMDKTINVYKGNLEKQNDFLLNAKIVNVDTPEGYEPKLRIQITPGGFLKYTCGANEFMHNDKDRVYNKQLMSIIKGSDFCQTMRDKRGNMKTVPNADFASTGGDMGGMA